MREEGEGGESERGSEGREKEGMDERRWGREVEVGHGWREEGESARERGKEWKE